MKPAGSASRRHAMVCACLAASALAGCEVFKRGQEAQGAIAANVIGMPVGDFADRYGRVTNRRENLDGSTEFDWESKSGYAAPGPGGLDERICRLHLTADPKGRITAADVVLDAQGKVIVSRCREIFEGRARP